MSLRQLVKLSMNTAPKGFKSNSFSLPTSIFTNRAAMRWLRRHLWWIIIPPMILIIASAWIPALIFVALMLIFLLYPAVTMMVYFHCTLSPYAQSTLYLQRITLASDGLTRIFISDERFSSVPENQQFAVSQIEYVELRNKNLFFKIKGGTDHYIILPLSAIPNEENTYEIITSCGIDFA